MVTSSSLRICSSVGVVMGGVAGAGVGTRSVGAGTGVGVVAVGVGCVCDDSDAFDGDADPGFAGREGCRGLPAAVAGVDGLVCSTVVSCVVEVPVTAATALARAVAMRSAWRARVFLRISILLSSILIFFTKSFTSPGLKKPAKQRPANDAMAYALEGVLYIPQISVTHLPYLCERCRAKRVWPFFRHRAHFLPCCTRSLFQSRARLGLTVEWGTEIILPSDPIAFPLKHTYDCICEHSAGRSRLSELLVCSHYCFRDPLHRVALECKLHLKRAITRGDPRRLCLFCERLQVME